MIRMSAQRREQLRSISRAQLHTHLGPVLDCKTRWNSTEHMIETAMKMRTPLIMLVASDKNLRQFELEQQEWDVLNDLLNFLKGGFARS